MPLTPLEISSGCIIPRRRGNARLPAGDATVRAAFEAALLPALQRAPCLVSFSGGRDSSAVLAVAAHVARREGLPLPIPATMEFPHASGTAETEWQEQVIGHLGLEDWFRVELTDELDCVGPVATESLRRHGVLWPCNAYFHVPLFRAAAGGSLATGFGGDEAFSNSIWTREIQVMRGEVRPVPRDVLRVGFALAPPAVKLLVLRRNVPETSPWLRPEPARTVALSLAREAAGEPLRWTSRFRWLLNSPFMTVALDSLERLAADADTALFNPFFDAGMLGALSRLPRDQRPDTRTQAMQMLVGDLLPPTLIGRATKARFDGVFFHSYSRELIDNWTGEGVDPSLVDVDALREEWAKETPSAHSSPLLQAVWLATRGSAVGELAQQGGRAGE